MNYGHGLGSRRVDSHQFTMVPRAEIPRSTFRMQHSHKLTFDAALLVPILVQEVLPGDTFNGHMTAYCRLATPIYPIMDNIEIETFFFFVPNRILWTHWVNFMGEQPSNPSESISYTIPTITSPASGFANHSIYDYMGIPGVGQIGGGATITINALPLRAYNVIYNQWFRDQNLQNARGIGATNTVYDDGDGPDPSTNYALQNAGKRHDYFTSALPWTQKATNPVTLPLGTQAIVKTNSTDLVSGAANPLRFTTVNGGSPTANTYYGPVTASTQEVNFGTSTSGGNFVGPGGNNRVYPSNLYADLSTATAATINQIRLAFQTQRLLERDARGGTRYQELLMSHFGVRPLDSRLQRPEYIGGGKTPINISPVPQTSGTGATGTSAPIGTLSGAGLGAGGGHSFRFSATEHGYIIGLLTTRNDKQYQQGLHRMWTRSTRYDFYWPVFSMLGEQGIRNDEIYCVGTPAQDTAIFGYQERWAEYRYYPSRTSGFFRSTTASTLDAWHLAQKFTALPTLGTVFIQDDLGTTIQRTLAAGASASNQNVLADLFFDVKAARPMPMYSVPGMLDHF